MTAPGNSGPTCAVGHDAPFECTVVVLTCNRPDLLEIALDSLQAQTLPPTLVIVSDDSRDDLSAALVARYPLLSYRRGPRDGQSANLREALLAVTTEHVAILHDDDWWEPGLLESARRAFDRTPRPDVFVPGIRYVDGSGADLIDETLARERARARTFGTNAVIWADPHERARKLLVEQPISAFQGTVFRRGALATWLRGPVHADLDDLWLCAELARPSAGALSVAYDPARLCNYRVHATSIASKIGAYMETSIEALATFRDDGDFASVRHELSIWVRQRAYQAAALQIAHGHRRRARELLAMYCPSPRSRKERTLAVVAFVPLTQLSQRVLSRRSARYRKAESA